MPRSAANSTWRRRIPGKEEFNETIRYYTRMLAKHGVDVRLGPPRHGRRARRASTTSYSPPGWCRACPTSPASTTRWCCRTPTRYAGRPIGARVAVIGAGGIGFDVSEFLVTRRVPDLESQGVEAEWGVVDRRGSADAGALARRSRCRPPGRSTCCSAPRAPQGRRLGKTPGWVHRASLEGQGRHQLSGVNYERIDDDGPAHQLRPDRTDARVLAVDNVVVCAGQESVRDLDRRTARAAAWSRTSSAAPTSPRSSTPSARSARARSSLPGSSPPRA